MPDLEFFERSIIRKMLDDKGLCFVGEEPMRVTYTGEHVADIHVKACYVEFHGFYIDSSKRTPKMSEVLQFLENIGYATNAREF